MKYDSWHDDLQPQEVARQTIPKQQTVDQRAELARQLGKEIVALFYDLSNCFSVIHSALYMLKIKKLSQHERDQYLEALSRNLSNAESMLDDLKYRLLLEAGKEINLSKATELAKLLKELRNQLPTTAPKEFEGQIEQLTLTLKALNY